MGKKKEERKRQNRRAKEKNQRALDEKRKEGERFLRGISKNQNTKQTRWGQTLEQGDHWNTSPENLLASWLSARMLVGKEKYPQNYVALGIKSQATFSRQNLLIRRQIRVWE